MVKSGVKVLFLFSILLLCSSMTFGVLDVHVLDQTSRPLDLFFTQPIGATTSVALNATVDQNHIIVTDASNFVVGTYVEIFSVEHHRYYFGNVISKTGTNLTIDTPLDFDVTIYDNVTPLSRDLNVDGSTSCETFSIFVPDVDSNLTIDITRIIFSMVMGSAGDDSKFGNINGGLTNGVDLRRTDGITENIFNIKTNGELLNLAFDGGYTDKSGGGNFGFRSRYTLGGQSKHGVTVLLQGGDKLSLLVCDDLSSLTSFRVIAAGHEVNITQNNGVEIIRSEEFEMLEIITIILVFIAIGFLLIISSYIFKNDIFLVFAGAWYVASAAATRDLMITISPYLSSVFFIGLALICFALAYGRASDNKSAKVKRLKKKAEDSNSTFYED